MGGGGIRRANWKEWGNEGVLNSFIHASVPELGYTALYIVKINVLNEQRIYNGTQVHILNSDKNATNENKMN